MNERETQIFLRGIHVGMLACQEFDNGLPKAHDKKTGDVSPKRGRKKGSKNKSKPSYAGRGAKVWETRRKNAAARQAAIDAEIIKEQEEEGLAHLGQLPEQSEE